MRRWLIPLILLALLGFSLLVHAAKPPTFMDLPPDLLAPTNTQLSGVHGPQSTVHSPSPQVPSPQSPSPAKQPTNSQLSTLNSQLSGMSALDDQHRLALGDRLSFRIVEDEEDPKPLYVTDSGDLEVPYIGRYPALGRTCKELAFALKTELEKDYYHNATVILAVDVMAKTKGRVYLVGPVRSPGPQEIPTDEVLTLSKAILRAGGFADFADKKKVKVTRRADGSDKTYVVDVAEILEKGRIDKDLPLEPGDRVYVPERLVRF